MLYSVIECHIVVYSVIYSTCHDSALPLATSPESPSQAPEKELEQMRFFTSPERLHQKAQATPQTTSRSLPHHARPAPHYSRDHPRNRAPSKAFDKGPNNADSPKISHLRR